MAFLKNEEEEGTKAMRNVVMQEVEESIILACETRLLFVPSSRLIANNWLKGGEKEKEFSGLLRNQILLRVWPGWFLFSLLFSLCFPRVQGLHTHSHNVTQASKAKNVKRI